MFIQLVFFHNLCMENPATLELAHFSPSHFILFSKMLTILGAIHELIFCYNLGKCSIYN